jgi:hypothetical protein
MMRRRASAYNEGRFAVEEEGRAMQENDVAWALSDEEWCELAFMMVELGGAHGELQDTLLREQRPSLHQLWVAAGAYKRQSEAMLGYLQQQLRNRALNSERNAT